MWLTCSAFVDWLDMLPNIVGMHGLNTLLLRALAAPGNTAHGTGRGLETVHSPS